MEENLNMQATEPKKKSKKKLIIIICIIVGVLIIGLTIFLIVSLISNKNQIIGEWKLSSGGESDKLYFKKDSTCYIGIIKGKYSIDGKTLKITTKNESIDLEIAEITSEKIVLNNVRELIEKLSLVGKHESLTFIKTDTNASESDLRIANETAREIYNRIDSAVFDAALEGHKVNSLNTGKVVSFESLCDLFPSEITDEINNSIIDAGYVYIEMNGEEIISVQWSESESGSPIGQYPDPAKTYDEAMKLKFGK